MKHSPSPGNRERGPGGETHREREKESVAGRERREEGPCADERPSLEAGQESLWEEAESKKGA